MYEVGLPNPYLVRHHSRLQELQRARGKENPKDRPKITGNTTYFLMLKHKKSRYYERDLRNNVYNQFKRRKQAR